MKRAFTAIEVLIALAITAMVGIGIASMLTMVGDGAQADRGTRSALLRAHAAQIRLRAFIDVSLNILTYDEEQGMAIWLHDNKPLDNIHLSELRIIWWDADAGELILEFIDFPDEWSEEMIAAVDVILAPDTDFFDEMTTQRVAGLTAQETLIESVDDFGATFSGNTATESNRAWISLNLLDDFESEHEVLLAFGLVNYMSAPGG